MITFACEKCGKKFSVPDEQAGKKGKCSQCQELIVIPPVLPGSSELPPPFSAGSGPTNAAVSPGVAPGAVAALICGILALCVPFVAIALGVIAIVLAVSAGRQIARMPGIYTGNGLRVAGMVTGIVGIVGWVISGAILLASSLAVDHLQERACIERTKTTMNVVMSAVDRYYDEKAKYPTDLSDLFTVDSCNDRLSISEVMNYNGIAMDGFDNPLQYTKDGGPGKRPELRSAGPDGAFDTVDDISVP